MSFLWVWTDWHVLLEKEMFPGDTSAVLSLFFCPQLQLSSTPRLPPPLWFSPKATYVFFKEIADYWQWGQVVLCVW